MFGSKDSPSIGVLPPIEVGNRVQSGTKSKIHILSAQGRKSQHLQTIRQWRAHGAQSALRMTAPVRVLLGSGKVNAEEDITEEFRHI